MLLFTALFVWIGAGQEASMTQMCSSLAGVSVSRAMLTKFDSLEIADPLSRAVDVTIQGSQLDSPVFNGDAVVGIVTRANLLKALAERSLATAVADAMQRDFPQVDAGEMLETSFARLQDCRCHTAPVTRGGRVVGLVTSENIGEFLMIQAAPKARAAAQPVPSGATAS